MIEIGKVNHLIVDRETDSGYHLMDPETNHEVFLPGTLAPKSIYIDQELAVFVHFNNVDSVIATTKIPYATVGEYAYLTAVDAPDFGAFFDLGIEKDLLVPGNEQKIKVQVGEQHLVLIGIDEETNRLFGTTKLDYYIEHSDFDINDGDNVSIVPFTETELGYRVIINKKFIGLIYHNEIFREITLNQPYDGIVKKIRDDGYVDISLQTVGIQHSIDTKDKIIALLKESNGHSDLNDKSDPLDIRNQLGISKKTFKNAIGMLYKSKVITISKSGIDLTN
ncbi:S1-like domain-containing RNA-binding protein [Bacteriovoracaceae bacterium]|nr:S1-like domain-containing RNA-binding protein [Bacteriovoracaceae bacterium]